MATGWAGDGAVQQQIDDSIADAIERVERELEVARANVRIQQVGIERAEKELANAAATLNSLQAETEKSRVTLEISRRNMDRRRALYQSGAVSESQTDDAQVQCRGQVQAHGEMHEVAGRTPGAVGLGLQADDALMVQSLVPQGIEHREIDQLDTVIGQGPRDQIAPSLGWQGGNRAWSHRAAVLVMALSRHVAEDGRELRMHAFDTGMAFQNLMLQATLIGLVTRPLGGFDKQRDAFTPAP